MQSCTPVTDNMCDCRWCRCHTTRPHPVAHTNPQLSLPAERERASRCSSYSYPAALISRDCSWVEQQPIVCCDIAHNLQQGDQRKWANADACHSDMFYTQDWWQEQQGSTIKEWHWGFFLNANSCVIIQWISLLVSDPEPLNDDSCISKIT